MYALVASSPFIDDRKFEHESSSPVIEESADRACLASFMSGLSDELEADGLLVACHTNAAPPVLLFRNDWNCQQVEGEHPILQLRSVAPVVSGQEPESL